MTELKTEPISAGAALPNQVKLADELGVNRLTVKKALDGLERWGLIYKQSGLGIFVSNKLPIRSEVDSPTNLFTGLKKPLKLIILKAKLSVFPLTFPVKKFKLTLI